MGFLTTFFNHAQAVQKAEGELGITASTQLADFGLRLELAGRTEVWSARFMARTGGRLAYTDALIPGTIGFAGWTPYAQRRWPVAVDKGAFKQFAFEHGLATPAACLEPAGIGGPFLIKKIDGSFGDGIRGPYVSYDAEDPDQRLQEGEYYENFIVGLIAKAWCWGDRCVAVHLHEPSTVTGDGGSTLRHLVEALPNTRGEHDWDLIVRLAAYCGIAGMLNLLVVFDVLLRITNSVREDPAAAAKKRRRSSLSTLAAQPPATPAPAPAVPAEGGAR